MAKTNILSRLGEIVSGIAGKRPNESQATGHRVLEGSDAPDNARAITEALRRMEDKDDAPRKAPLGGQQQQQQQQQKVVNTQKAMERQRSWMATTAAEYKEKVRETRTAIDRGGTTRRPSRAEGAAETVGLSKEQRIDRLKSEGLAVEQKISPTGKETELQAVQRTELQLLDLREKENKALSSKIGQLMMLTTTIGRATMVFKQLLKFDLAFRGANEVIKQWSDGLMQSKENLREYNGVIAGGLAVMDAAEMERNVRRGLTTQAATSSYMRQKRGYDDAMAKMAADFENLKTRFAAIGMWFMKWSTRVIYYISPITYLSKGVELIASWFGFGAEDEEAPSVLYMEFLGMVADGKFEGPHQARPTKK